MDRGPAGRRYGCGPRVGARGGRRWAGDGAAGCRRGGGRRRSRGCGRGWYGRRNGRADCGRTGRGRGVRGRDGAGRSLRGGCRCPARRGGADRGVGVRRLYGGGGRTRPGLRLRGARGAQPCLGCDPDEAQQSDGHGEPYRGEQHPAGAGLAMPSTPGHMNNTDATLAIRSGAKRSVRSTCPVRSSCSVRFICSVRTVRGHGYGGPAVCFRVRTRVRLRHRASSPLTPPMRRGGGHAMRCLGRWMGSRADCHSNEDTRAAPSPGAGRLR
jgi:hypothetical protein